MADFQRYLARTEAWARVVEDDTEDVVTSTGKQTAYNGDLIVIQKMRGEDFTYIMTQDDFAEDWVLAEEKNTDAATSSTGVDPLPETVPPEDEETGGGVPGSDVPDYTSTGGENTVDSGTATAGTQHESPTPADAPADDTSSDVTPTAVSGRGAHEESTVADAPTPTAGAPTGGGAGDTTTTDNAPNVGTDTAPGMSPVAGVDTPDAPADAPTGSAASEVTESEAPVDEAPGNAVPDETATTPSQTVSPSDAPASTGVGESSDGGDAATATGNLGGDEGTTPTPTEDAPTESTAVTPESLPTDTPSTVEGDESDVSNSTDETVRPLPKKAVGRNDADKRDDTDK